LLPPDAIFKAEMHQIRYRLSSVTEPAGELTALSRLPSGAGRAEGREERGRESEEESKGEGREGMVGRVGGGPMSPTILRKFTPIFLPIWNIPGSHPMLCGVNFS